MVRVDTGAMYRAVALAARSKGVPWSDPVRLGAVAREVDLSFRAVAGSPRVFLSGEDVSDAIRAPEISMGPPPFSVHGPVREALVAKQRRCRGRAGSSSRGATPGRSSSPDAEAKFFLDAAAAVRARRASSRFPQRGPSRSRRFFGTSPARRAGQHAGALPPAVADGAVYIDSTTMTVDEVVGEMLDACPGPAVTKKVLIARSAGFCFGVKRAIAIADETPEAGGGDAEGRPDPVARPDHPQPTGGGAAAGERRTRRGDVDEITCGKVIIRSHGVTRSDRAALEGKGVTIVDATCPFVTKARSTPGH